MIQSHHMLYELLNCEKGDSVSVEVFDDVGVEHPDGSRDAIQLKSALSNRNPVSNKAIDLWKTMYNWMLSAETGELDPENTKYETMKKSLQIRSSMIMIGGKLE